MSENSSSVCLELVDSDKTQNANFKTGHKAKRHRSMVMTSVFEEMHA